VSQAVVILPDNGRDRLSSGGTPNGQHPAHQSPAPRLPTVIVELPPRDGQ
jgi:hypothetical protein